MARLCWLLAVVCACSSGNAQRPAGPPPVYEPRPMGSYEAPQVKNEPDPVDALLDGPPPTAPDDSSDTEALEPSPAHAPSAAESGATTPPPSAAATVPPVNTNP